jgi:2-aminoadipate transaminase
MASHAAPSERPTIPAEDSMQTLWSERFARRTRTMRSSAVRELLKVLEQPDMISFGGGLPGPEVFPVERVREATDRVLRDRGRQALQYSTTEGYRPLRELVARHTARYGILIEPDNVLLTNGSQQALDAIGKVFINRGDHILAERPTYIGAIQAWQTYGAEWACVEVDEDGMNVDEVESALRGGPKFIYALPNFQNPSGVTLALERRHRLIQLADHYGVPILEDDPYGQLRYEGEHLPSIVTLDARMHATDGAPYAGNVIYISTFSKILSPGLRLGWIVAPVEVIQRLVMAKQGMDLHTTTFTQMVVYEVARGGFLDEHIKIIRDTYRVRRDAMLAAMDRHFPEGVTWTRPKGGLFLWVTLPPFVSTTDVLKAAIAQKVAFVPGEAFFPDGTGQNTARLNFSYSNPDIIEEGVRRLGGVLKAMMRSGALVSPGRIAAPA